MEHVSLLPIIVTMVIGLFGIAILLYVAVIGRIGWQIFMYNFPLTKKRGAFYLILQRNGQFKWVYTKFKSVWVWPDKTKSFIGKKFNRIAQTTEPLIFLMEGYPTNAMLSDLLPKEEMSMLVNNIIKTQETAARLEMNLSQDKPALFDKLIPMLTLGFAAGSALLVLAVFMNMDDITTAIKPLVTLANQVQPYVPQLVEALENIPREI